MRFQIGNLRLAGSRHDGEGKLGLYWVKPIDAVTEHTLGVGVFAIRGERPAVADPPPKTAPTPGPDVAGTAAA